MVLRIMRIEELTTCCLIRASIIAWTRRVETSSESPGLIRTAADFATRESNQGITSLDMTENIRNRWWILDVGDDPEFAAAFRAGLDVDG